MYLYQLWASIFAFLRLRKGLPLTFEVRKKVAIETFKCLMTYAAYLSILMLCFIILTSNAASSKPKSSINNFAFFLLFIIANKGSVDGIVWFMLHDFVYRHKTADSLKQTSTIPQDSQNELGLQEVPDHFLHLPHDAEHLKAEVEKLKKNMTKTLTELADLAIEDIDETDMSPQVNTALRRQIVAYVTKGIRDSVLQSNVNQPTSSVTNKLLRVKKDIAVVEGINVLEFSLDGEHPFKSFAPEMFRELRANEGILDEYYLKVLSSTANERLSEGASGAFMFFCGGGEFIVKTIRAREARVLHSSLRKYSNYLHRNKESFLCRFLGSYSLAVYSQIFYFVVMRNCFDPKIEINERFDIKGR
jgi:1-phosphatidylinositol-4-phosphate 5-kinase